ncbi:LPS export ABC transporter permease LptF [Maricurvus nonylphenolicus]|uniref:LPS export ABC transporter permease LptF n=1 Tax=Maricurvus nonylphenolicus TaxID=1008307 RepID=UPI0036F35F10
MIIFRYLAREVLLSMVAVSGILLLIIMSGRFVKYLSQAAAGKLAPEVLFAIMGYRLPGFLELVLPLGLFIAILLAYGRLYMDSEMTVLSACGMSQKRLLGYTLMPGVVVAVIVALLSLYVSPLGAERSDILLNEQKQRSEFDHLSPARFQATQGGTGVTYARKISEDRTLLHNVFMAEMASRDKGKADAGENELAVILAESGEQYIDPDNGERYLLLHNGYRYTGRPGELEYEEIKFDRYAQYLAPMEDIDPYDVKSDALPTAELWQSDKLEDRATLQWRVSLPVLVLVVTMLAVPLSHTNPRQGRYVQMIPAILIYIFYLVSLNAARGNIEDGKLPVEVGMWAVHAVFFALALILLTKDNLMLALRARKAQAGGKA